MVRPAGEVAPKNFALTFAETTVSVDVEIVEPSLSRKVRDVVRSAPRGTIVSPKADSPLLKLSTALVALKPRYETPDTTFTPLFAFVFIMKPPSVRPIVRTLDWDAP